MGKLFTIPKGIIPACDVRTLRKLGEVMEATCEIPGVSAYKLGGISLGIRFGLAQQVQVAREYTKRPLIYDHQKGGTDIPEMGIEFALAVREAGANAAILFPLAGPVTEAAWIKACQSESIEVLVGGHMTHTAFLETEGGFIKATGPEGMYTIAVELGVTHFIVPGNRVEYVQKYYRFFADKLGEGNFDLSAPGFIKQGGQIADTGKVAGPLWHAISGTAVCSKESVPAMHEAAQQLTSQIVA